METEIERGDGEKMKRIIKQLEAKRVKLAKLRDELRDLEGTLRDQADNADYALEDLEHCIATLSEYV